MKIIFDYNKEKDIGCILNFGKGSINSNSSTKTYNLLVSKYGENPTEGDTSNFIKEYISSKGIDVEKYRSSYQNDWDIISDEYQKISERIFKVSLPKDITAYLTLNDRCPYNIYNNLFFVTLTYNSTKSIVMHELWHFYTWYKFGVIWEEKLGKQKYNDIKESLTVLLNIECKDLFPENKKDIGYPQHQELREKIIKIWNETKDIDKLWVELIS